MVSPSISFSAQYQLVEVPTLTGWTVETSVSEGFDTQKLGGTTDGWGDMNFQPITTGFEIEKNLAIYTDRSGSFKNDGNYIIYGFDNSLSFGLNTSTLRIIADSFKGTSPDAIRLEQNSELTITGDSNSALQIKSTGMRFVFLDPDNKLTVSTGDVWFQFKPDVSDPSALIQNKGDFEINAFNDIVFLVDASYSGKIEYLIEADSSGDLNLDAKRMFIGIESANASLSSNQHNRLVSIEGGSANIGSDRTELIALNGGRVGIQLTANVESFGLQTNKLQLLGDDHPDSIGIYIESDSYKSDGFIAQEAYIGKVGTGIIVNGGKADMKFERLWNEAFAKSVFLNDGKLTLEVGDSAHFGKEIDVGYGDLVLNGGQYEINNRVYVCMFV